MKQYRQFCSVARALDAVGDRWALLVVRELLLGPRRYTDLLDGLPGVGTNVLATRLRDLEDQHIIARRQLPPPTPVTVYELTDDGRALRPILHELSRWGMRRLGDKHPDDATRAGWFLLAVSGSVDTNRLTPGDTYQLQVGEETFTLAVGDHGAEASAGATAQPTATITAELPALFQMAAGRQPLTGLLQQAAITISGDRAAGQRLLKAIERLRWAGADPEVATKGRSAARTSR